jgi:hypothetical protein
MEYPVSLGDAPVAPPLVVDSDLGDNVGGGILNHSFTTSSGDSPFMWGNLTASGPSVPAIAPTLSADGIFSWNTVGSPFGLYHFEVTTANAGGSDVGRLSINLTSPPPRVIDPQPHVFEPIPTPVVPVDEPPPPLNQPGFVDPLPHLDPKGTDPVIIEGATDVPPPWEPIVWPWHEISGEIVDRPFVWLTPELQESIDAAEIPVDVDYTTLRDGLFYVSEFGGAPMILPGIEDDVTAVDIAAPIDWGVTADGTNLVRVAPTFQSFGTRAAYWSRFSGTSAGVVSLDTSLALVNKLYMAASELSSATVPEPDTPTLFGLASIGLLTVRRRS